MLFNLFIHYVFSQMQLPGGVSLGQTETPLGGDRITEDAIRTLKKLLFADDIVSFATTREALQAQLEELHRVFSKFGMLINHKKTEFMVTGSRNLAPLEFPLGPVKNVRKFRYLGEVLNTEGTCLDAIERRTHLGDVAMRNMSTYIYSKHTSKAERLAAFNCYVVPVVMSGCENWLYRKGFDMEEDKLRKWHMKHTRRMLRIGRLQQRFEKISDAAILQRYKQLPLVLRCKAKQWRYAGHIYRRNGNRWAKYSLSAKLTASDLVGQGITLQKHFRSLGEEMAAKYPAGCDTPWEWERARDPDREKWMEFFWDFHGIPEGLRPGRHDGGNTSGATVAGGGGDAAAQSAEGGQGQ
jgi:hypothetical protein